MINRRVLYIGWVGFGNHGDDICRDVFMQRFGAAVRQCGIDLDVIALYPSRFDEFTLARINPDLVVLGAGSLFELVYLRPLSLAQQAGIPTAIWGSGYDSTAEEPEIPHDLAYAIRQVVAESQVVGVRGPYTVRALESVGAVREDLLVTGDPGLLWSPDPLDTLEPGSGSVPQLAVNWGTAYDNVLGKNEQRVAAALAEVLRDAAANFRLLLYPMWHRDIEPCLALANSIGWPDRVRVMTEVPSPQELQKIYRLSLFSINMKLHASIFSAALGCPFISLAYRWKCMDFAESVACGDLAIPFGDPHLAERLRAAIDRITADPAEHRDHLTEQISAARLRLAELEQRMVEILSTT